MAINLIAVEYTVTVMPNLLSPSHIIAEISATMFVNTKPTLVKSQTACCDLLLISLSYLYIKLINSYIVIIYSQQSAASDRACLLIPLPHSFSLHL